MDFHVCQKGKHGDQHRIFFFFNTGYPLLLNGIGLTKILAEDSKSFTEVLAPVYVDTVGNVTKTV